MPKENNTKNTGMAGASRNAMYVYKPIPHITPAIRECESFFVLTAFKVKYNPNDKRSGTIIALNAILEKFICQNDVAIRPAENKAIVSCAICAAPSSPLI